jgi:hypothetical protein
LWSVDAVNLKMFNEVVMTLRDHKFRRMTSSS